MKDALRWRSDRIGPMMVSICQSDLQLTLRLRIAGGQGAEASFR